MKIWFDGQCLQTASRFRGIGRYVNELLRALASRPDVTLSISFNAAMAESALLARAAVAEWIEPHNIHVWEGPDLKGEAYEGYSQERRMAAVAFAHHVACLAPDAAISASPFEGQGDAAVPLEPSSLIDAPIASIFYDAIPHRYPDRYLSSPLQRETYARRLALLKSYDLNLCISGYSTCEAEDIAAAGDNVDIGAGVAPALQKFLDAPPVATPPKPYALYVGGLDWRKNVGALARAFALLPTELRERLRLVIAGDHPADQLQGLRDEWMAQGLRPERLVTRAHVSDRELVSLYRACAVAVQPSYLEGFGLTALEAMLCGAPTIAAARGAAPEVVQDVDMMFDPDDHAQIAGMIRRLVEEPHYARRKAAEGRERARAFSWDRTAEIAHLALARVSAARGRVPRTLDERREAAVAALVKANALTANAAETFVRAESVGTQEARLFVDCSSLVSKDGLSGIQRVTREIGERLQTKFGARCVFGDRTTPFVEVSWRDGKPVVAQPQRGVVISGHDKALMLDSSWIEQSGHFSQLISARLRGADITTALYDLVPLRSPGFCAEPMPLEFVNWLKSALVYSTGFVCISRAVAEEFRDLLEAIQFPRPMKIGWWPLGADFRAAAVAPAPRAPGGRARFLMVGTIEPRKGYDVALAGFERLWAQGVEAELTIIGKPGWNTEALVARMRAHPEAGRRLNVRQNVSDDELAQAYAQADALISTSHAEGFGLPLVEARHFGKPAIVSDLAVFREVTEGARGALFFTPGDPDALAGAVRDFLAGAAPPASGAQFDWPDWDESAACLKRVVEGDWGMEYRPRELRPFAALDDPGRTRMTRALGAEERGHAVSVLACERASAGELRARVRIVNRSPHLWSSNLDDGGALGVFLEGRALDAGGRAIGPPARATIPFVLPAGWDATLDLTFAGVKKATRLALSLKQKGGENWGTVETPLD